MLPLPGTLLVALRTRLIIIGSISYTPVHQALQLESSIINALHPAEHLGSPPKIHERQLRVSNRGPSFTRNARDSTLVQHRRNPGIYLLSLLLPQNICFPILDGITLSFELKPLTRIPLSFLREHV
jgi:hypothetical protein